MSEFSLGTPSTGKPHPDRFGFVTRRCLLRAICCGTLAGPAANGQDKPAPIAPDLAADRFPVKFVDVAQRAGLTRPIYYGEEKRSDFITEANGCGVAFYDYDNDGWLDIFLLNGSRRSGFPDGEEPTNRLYKNNRDGTFTDVTDAAGLAKSGWANGVCIGDFDNDGFDDLFVTYRGRNVLYHNNGDGTFTDVTDAAGVGGDPRFWSTGCTFLDYDRDGHLDLFVTNYIGPKSLEDLPPKGRTTWKGVPVAYGPQGLEMGTQVLYRNNGDGTFTEVSKEGRIQDTRGYGLTAMATDFNDDGWPDIYVACDSSPSLLFRNNRDGTFSDIATERGLAYSSDGVAQAGMGLAIGDYTGDGHLDLVKTHFADDVPGLYRNDGRGYFADESTRAGLRASARHLEWGAGFVDFDNDGQPELFYVTGSVYPEVEAVNPDYPYRGPRLLFLSLPNGRFENVSQQCGPGLREAHSSRGCAFGDFDNDGDMDVLVMNMNEPPSLLRADCDSKGHWLKVKLHGTRSNRSAIGARVFVRVGRSIQVQELHSQTSYLSVNDFRLHFGLGSSRRVDAIRVRWPSGQVEQTGTAQADRLVHIVEGRGIVEAETLKNPSA